MAQPIEQQTQREAHPMKEQRMSGSENTTTYTVPFEIHDNTKTRVISLADFDIVGDISSIVIPDDAPFTASFVRDPEDATKFLRNVIHVTGTKTGEGVLGLQIKQTHLSTEKDTPTTYSFSGLELPFRVSLMGDKIKEAIRTPGDTLREKLHLDSFETHTKKREEMLRTPRHHVLVVGSGVAGTEAAGKLADAGIAVTVIESQERYGGKVLGGLPFWHETQRQSEVEKMLTQLSHPLIQVVPGQTVSDERLQVERFIGMGYRSVVLAQGAWIDNRLKTKDNTKMETILDHGFEYQNAFINRMNDWWASGQDFTEFQIGDEDRSLSEPRIVIGGGLASIDCVKALKTIDLYKQLKSRGIDVNIMDITHDGVTETVNTLLTTSPSLRELLGTDALEGTPEDEQLLKEKLGVRPVVLVYRKSLSEIKVTPPLKDKVGETVPERTKREEKQRENRERIARKFASEFMFTIQTETEVVNAQTQDGTNIITFSKPIGSTDTTPVSFLISSIGSNSTPIEVSRAFASENADAKRVILIGNAATQQGNIVASRQNAREETDALIKELSTLEVDSYKHDFIAREVSPVLTEMVHPNNTGDHIAWTVGHTEPYVATTWKWATQAEQELARERFENDGERETQSRQILNNFLRYVGVPYAPDAVMWTQDMQMVYPYNGGYVLYDGESTKHRWGYYESANGHDASFVRSNRKVIEKLVRSKRHHLPNEAVVFQG